MVDPRAWSGLVRGRHDRFDELHVRALIGSAGQSFASPFQVLASDGRRYFVKALGGCQEFARGSLAVEYVVAEAGRLIGAPVCESSLIRIPEIFADWPMPFGKLQPGIAHASAAIEQAVESRPALQHRMQDDNRRRQVGLYALYDWCFGDDPQWLHDVGDDRSVYSHDHGLYLPPHDGSIRAALLRQCVDEPNELADPADGLDPEAARRVSEALERIDRDALVKVVRGAPASWPVTDDVLEHSAGSSNIGRQRSPPGYER
ncbi:HipA family kinase [Nonomuraea wenchangensis]|uniref:HipA family kinase n=1 Tax=Nonomuraea wenchangensis TaxID=568860 RepID=UPI0034136F9B